MMNIICNFQISSTRHQSLVPDCASCPSYFILNLITSSCAINNISPRQIGGLQTIKRMDCGHCCGDISINCSCNPTGTEWWPHILFLFLYKLRKISLTKNDFPVLARPVMNTLCPLSTTSSTSLWSTVNLQGGITHETHLFSSTYTPSCPTPPHQKKYIFKGASWKDRKVLKRWTIDFKHVKWSMILLYIYTEIYFNLTNKYCLLKLLALWLVGYFPHQWKSSHDQSPIIGQLPMTSFYYNYPNPWVCCFLVQIKAFVL